MTCGRDAAVCVRYRPGSTAREREKCIDAILAKNYADDRKDRSMASRPLRTEKLDLRLTKAAMHRLKAAAAASHRSVSDFVLESALAKADGVLAERQFFLLDTQWRTFTAALDAPPRPLPRMRCLLREPALFDPAER